MLHLSKIDRLVRRSAWIRPVTLDSLTNTGANQDSDFDVEDVLSRSTIRTINSDDGQRTSRAARIELYEITTSAIHVLVLLITLHSGLCQCRHYGRTSANSFTKTLGPITDLTDVNGHIRVFRCRCDGKLHMKRVSGVNKMLTGGIKSTHRMPLPAGDIRDLNEEPLTSDIFEAGFDNTKFHGTRGMNKDLGQPSGTTSPDFSVDSLSKVDDTRPHGESPTFITQTMVGSIEWEHLRVCRIGRVTDETTGCMSVKADHEEESEVVSIPECLEALVANLVVCGSIHEEHDEKHKMPGNTTSLGVMDIESDLRANLYSSLGSRDTMKGNKIRTSTLDVEKVDIMSRRVNHRPESH